jgi:hypothetical protein
MRLLPDHRRPPTSSSRPRPAALVGAHVQSGVQGSPEARLRPRALDGCRSAEGHGAGPRLRLALLGVRRRFRPGEPKARAARAWSDALGVAEGLLACVRDGASRAPLCGAVGRAVARAVTPRGSAAHGRGARAHRASPCTAASRSSPSVRGRGQAAYGAPASSPDRSHRSRTATWRRRALPPPALRCARCGARGRASSRTRANRSRT